MSGSDHGPTDCFGRLAVKVAASDADMEQVAQLRRVRFRANRSADLGPVRPAL